MTSKCMVDIETLGTEPGSVVLSIGAVQFDKYSTGDTFYRAISSESCQNAGLSIDAGTLDWWLQQDEEAQHALTGGEDLESALLDFADFYSGCDEVWANAPTFDCRLLKAAYEAVDEELPWSFRDERCYRTLKNLPNAVTEPHTDFDGVAHDALDDARRQAQVAQRNLNKFRD